MALTEQELEAYQAEKELYRKLTEQSKKAICSFCEGPLVVRWYQGKYELGCGKDKSHTGTKSRWDSKAYRERNARENGKIT